jgi:hypothetical protein
MHVDTDEVVGQMRANGFAQQAEQYQGHILILEREE